MLVGISSSFRFSPAISSFPLRHIRHDRWIRDVLGMISRELFQFFRTIHRIHFEIGVRYPSVMLTGDHIPKTILQRFLLWHWFPTFGVGSPVAIQSTDRLRSSRKFRSTFPDRLTWPQMVSQLWSEYKAPWDEKGVEQCIPGNFQLAEQFRVSSQAKNTTGSRFSKFSRHRCVGCGGT